MKIFAVTLLVLLCSLAVAPESHAHTPRRNRILKTVDVSADPAVKAAEEKHREIERALKAARDKNDREAVRALEDEHDVSEKELKDTRNATLAKRKNRR